ncbi:hypothetical protein AX15_002091 [Amanita polypyramis BW_CC]|nr:hypothetical protein AX15_002091 [Amanita polypyramis BW_CC]
MSMLEAREPRRTSVRVRGSALILLSFQTLGIVYSDLGTSPLYALNGIWPSTGPLPSSDDIIGGISAIIWALTLLPLILVSLCFGTGEGEGGTFALYQGLYPPADYDYGIDRTLTYQEYEGDSRRISSSTYRYRISKGFHLPILIWCLLGTSLTMADGIFTPAVSVTSAVTGISVVKPSVTKGAIPISIAFLVALFLLQQFGTSRISFLFAPISLLWFVSIAIIGVINIVSYPGILRAFDPSRAVLMFIRTKNYDILTGIILALTGCEATFANLGQFNATSIRLAFCFVVYPSVLLAYMGQGARLILDGERVLPNVFWNTIPGPASGPPFWIIFVITNLAALVASQSLISGTFSLLQQVINLKSFPPLQMFYTSNVLQGHAYIPAVNWFLMILTIIIVAAFGKSQNLTNAYGFAVATVMFSTSILLSISMYYVKYWHWIASVIFLLCFGFLDGLLWAATLKKVVVGAWVPLLIGLILTGVMLLWTWGKKLEDHFDGSNRQNLSRFIQEDHGTDNKAALVDDPPAGVIDRTCGLTYASGATHRPGPEEKEKRELVRISTCSIFHKSSRGPGIPHTFVGLIRRWPSLPRVVVFLSVCVLPTATVPAEDRYKVKRVRSVEGIYGITYYVGFRDEFNIENDALAEKICAAEIEADPNTSPNWLADIKRLTSNPTHIVPHYHVISRKAHSGLISFLVVRTRRWLIEDLYGRIATIFPETANWLTPSDEVMRVGITAFV